MLLTIQNLSADPIVAHRHHKPSKFNVRRNGRPTAPLDEFHLPPSSSYTTSLAKGPGSEIVIRHDGNGSITPDSTSATGLATKEWHIHPDSFKIDFSLALGASWQVIDVPKGCPWVIFKSRVSFLVYMFVVTTAALNELRLQGSTTNFSFLNIATLDHSCLNYLTTFHCHPFSFQVCCFQ